MLGWRRVLYNTAREHRISAWHRARVSVSRVQADAALQDIRAALPADAASHAHVLPDLLARLDKTSQACLRRVRAGEKAGFPREQGRDRSPSCTDKECGTGATLDTGCRVLSTSGRIAVRWSRPLEGTAKTGTSSREAHGWSVGFACADVPVQPPPTTGQETGIDQGIDRGSDQGIDLGRDRGRDRGRESFAIPSKGRRSFHPGG